MKRNVIVGLILMMGLMVIGCPTETKNEDSRVVAEQYRGNYRGTGTLTNQYWEITKNTAQNYGIYDGNRGNISDVYKDMYTKDNYLYEAEYTRAFGWFEDNFFYKDMKDSKNTILKFEKIN